MLKGFLGALLTIVTLTLWGQNLERAHSYQSQITQGFNLLVKGPGGDLVTLEDTRDSLDVDFGPGVQQVKATHTNQDKPFIARYDSALNFKSVKVFDGKANLGLVLLRYQNHHFYLFCNGRDSVDFDFSAGNSYAVSGQTGNHDYIVKYDSAFNLVWVKRLSNTTGSTNLTAARIAPSGSIYIAGKFTGSLDVDPGVGTQILTKTHTRGSDIFFAKYNANGDLVYSQHLKGSYDSRNGFPFLHLNPDSTVYVSCNVENGMDIDPGAGVVNISRKEGFFARYDAAGNYLWKLNTTGNYYCSDAVTDSAGNAYFTGTAVGGMYFNAGTASTRVYTNGLTNGKDMFLLKLNSQGTIQWVRESSAGGTLLALRGKKLAIDRKNKGLYLLGDVGGAWQLYAPNDSLQLTTKYRNTYRDAVFVGAYDLNGNLRYALNTVSDTSNGSAYAHDIQLVGADRFAIRGAFQFRHDFDPNPQRKSTLTSFKNSLSSTFLAIYKSNNAPELSAITDTALCATNDTLKIPFTVFDDVDTNATVTWMSSNDTLFPQTSISTTGQGYNRMLCVSLSDTVGGTFTLTGIVFDADSLSDTMAFNLTLSRPVIDSILTTHPLCYGDSSGSIQVFGRGGLGTLSYSLDSVTFLATNPLVGLPASKPFIWLKDSLGCLAKDSTILFNPDSLYFTGATTQQPICNGQASGQITLHAKGGSGPRTFSIASLPYQVDSVFKNLRAFTYYFVVKDSNSCTDSMTLVLNQADRVVIDSIKRVNVDCYARATGRIEVYARGGTGRLTYRTNNDPKQFNSILSGLRANTQYNIRVEDSNGCYVFVPNIRLTQPRVLISQVTVTQTITCNGGSDGAITASARGGNGFYTYSIDNVKYTKNASFTGLPATGAKLYVKDTLGCITIRSLSIQQPSRINATLTKVKDVTCYSLNDGEATASASGGNGGFLYAFNGGNFTPATQYTNLGKGTYTLTVQDRKQCTSTAGNITITAPDSIRLSTTVVDEKNGNDGEITVLATGGTAPFTYSINGTNYGNSAVFGGLTGGSYTLYAQDNNHCRDSIQTEVHSTVGVGISNSNSNVQLLVGPNPTSGKLYIDLGTSYPEVTLTIRNVAGQVVLEKPVTTPKFQTTLNAPSGVYLLELSTGTTVLHQQRLIKQ